MKYIIITTLILFFIGCTKKDVLPSNPPPPPVQDLKLPKLITNNISNLTDFSVTFSGKLVDSSGSKISDFGIVVDTVSMATVDKNYRKFEVLQRNPDGTFSINITYLPSDVTFYIRAYATNANGTGYGNEIKFITLQQKTFEGDVNLTTQQQVVDFGANHYTVINGALNLSGSVSDVTPLLGLTIINNGFNATNTLLSNFKGLDSLQITGALLPNDFWVERNENLINFSGLGKLQITRGSVQIDNNNSLINLDGLNSYIAASSGTLRIGDCKKLQNLNGLKKMTFIGQDCYIINNPVLNDITGLSNLSTLPGRLYIVNNSILQNLNGLEKVQALSDGIEITNNPSLSDLSGLRNLTSITSLSGIGTITINNNPMLIDLSVFNQISTIDYIYIENNTGLKNLSGLKGLQSINHILHIENDSGLVDLSGIEKLSSINRLEIVYNSGIINLKGLSGLTKIITNGYSIEISGNNSLQSLTGIENLAEADGSVQIFNNPVLSDFCPLKLLFSSGYTQFYSATNNLSNPSQNDVVANCP